MPLCALISEAVYSNLGGRVVGVERGGERAAEVASKLDALILCVSRRGRRFHQRRRLVRGREMDWDFCEQSKKAYNLNWRVGTAFPGFRSTIDSSLQQKV